MRWCGCCSRSCTSCSAGRGPSGPESRTFERNRRLALRGAQDIEGQVVGDGEQPGRELRLRMILLAAAVDAQEHFLGQVLGFLGVADQVVHHGDETMMIQLDQFGEAPRRRRRGRAASAGCPDRGGPVACWSRRSSHGHLVTKPPRLAEVPIAGHRTTGGRGSGPAVPLSATGGERAGSRAAMDSRDRRIAALTSSPCSPGGESG